MLTIFFFFGGISLTVLRLALGAVLGVHGWNKLKNLKGTTEWFQSVGFRPGIFWGTLATMLEFFGGIAFILGLFVQPIAAIFVLEFIVIILWRLIRRNPFVGGWEFDLVILGGLVVLLLLGAGSYSLDRAFFSSLLF